MNNLHNGSESIDTRGLAGLTGMTEGLMSEVNTVAYQSDGKQVLTDGKDKETLAPVPPQENRWGFFAAGTGLFGDFDTDKNQGRLSDASFTSWGLLFGADAKLGEHFIIGAYGDYTHTWADLDNQGSNAEINTYGGGIYAGYHGSPPYVNAVFSYARNDYDSRRTINFVGLPDPVAHGSTSGDQYGGDISGGYDFTVCDKFTIGPFAGLQYLHLNVDDFNETGAGLTDLAIGQDLDSLRSRLGVKADLHARLRKNVAIALDAHAAWQHEFLDDSHNIDASFIGAGLPSFVVPTTVHGRDSALAGVGVNATLWDMLTFFADYNVQAGQSDYLVQSANGGLRISF